MEFEDIPINDRDYYTNEQLLNKLLEGVIDYAIFLLDSNGFITSWNSGAEHIKGYNQDEIIGRHFSIFYPREDIVNSKPAQALETALHKGHFEEEGWKIRKDGTRFWANSVITPVYDSSGFHTGFTKITKDLTERKKSEDKFKGILESAPDAMVIVDAGGKIQMVNAQTENLFDYKREEMIGNDVEILIPERFVSKHYNHRMTYNADPKIRAMGIGLELYGRRKGGSEFPVEISLSPVQIAGEGLLVFAAIRDITIQKKAQLEIKQLNEQLDRKIAERASELELSLISEKKALEIASLQQQKIVFLAKASELLASTLDYKKSLSDLATQIILSEADWCLFNLTHEGTIIKPVVISHKDPEKIKTAFDIIEEYIAEPVRAQVLYDILEKRKPQIFSGISENQLKEFAGNDLLYNEFGPLDIHSLICVPLIVRDKIYGLMTLIRGKLRRSFDQQDLDLAIEIARRVSLAIENRKLYTEAQELNHELEQRVAARTAELEAINKELEAFSYSVSHDLRAPLRSIDGFSNLILKKYAGLLDDQGQDYFTRVINASQQMGHLIDDLLKLSRITRTEINIRKINLSEIVESITNEFIQAQPERRINVEVVPNIYIHADPDLMQVALFNMLENALKYSRNNPQTEIRFGKIKLDGKDVYFIKDNGVGFDMKYVDKLFGAFQRLHSSSEFEGTGIGLATVQRIIRRHKGKIWAESEINKGTTFFFTIG